MSGTHTEADKGDGVGGQGTSGSDSSPTPPRPRTPLLSPRRVGAALLGGNVRIGHEGASRAARGQTSFTRLREWLREEDSAGCQS